MNNTQLQATIAGLESKLDVMETEYSYLNDILVKLGFSEGVKSLKSTIEDIFVEEDKKPDLSY